MANHWIETAVGGVEVREVPAATLPPGEWWTKARNGWGTLILITTAENVERLKTELIEAAERHPTKRGGTASLRANGWIS